MAVQNELLNLLQAESEATVVYAAIVLSQVRKKILQKLCSTFLIVVGIHLIVIAFPDVEFNTWQLN